MKWNLRYFRKSSVLVSTGLCKFLGKKKFVHEITRTTAAAAQQEPLRYSRTSLPINLHSSVECVTKPIYFSITMLCYKIFYYPSHILAGSTYREPGKGMQVVLSNSQAGPGRTVKQEQEEISCNHVRAFSGGPVHKCIRSLAQLLFHIPD